VAEVCLVVVARHRVYVLKAVIPKSHVCILEYAIRSCRDVGGRLLGDRSDSGTAEGAERMLTSLLVTAKSHEKTET